MPECHPDTNIEISEAVPTSGFRNRIPNTQRYMKRNKVTIEQVCEVAYVGDYDRLEELLSTGDEKNLFNGDLNLHVPALTCLHLAAKAGQTECIELLLAAGADPHMKECMAYGHDPEDGKTAREVADDLGFDDIVDLLKTAEEATPYGWYVPEGPTNNRKMYGGWEWKAQPEKGWYSSRPGVAQRNGFDPCKYGAPPPKPPKIFEDLPAEAGTSAPSREAITARRQPLPIGLLFSGQGSQYVGMLKEVKDIPKVRGMLNAAESIMGMDMLDLCLKGTSSRLEETSLCQPAMFIAGMAALEKLRLQKPDAIDRAQAVAGLELGEFTALCVAGVFSFDDGLKLVKLRGEAMQEAANIRKQGTASVAGIDKATLAALCRKAADAEGPDAVCEIATELFPKGYTCSGTEAAIVALQDLATNNGALQAKIQTIKVGWNSPLMATAAAKLSKALDEALPNMQPPRMTVYMNATGAGIPPGTSPKQIVELLKRQTVSPVLWEASMRAMIADGVTEFYECGPMKQLKAMMKRIDPKVYPAVTNIDI